MTDCSVVNTGVPHQTAL